jgi:Ca-activated chloride channel family protein
VRTEPGARGHLATATVRWLDPETRDPHEETGDLEADALHESLWSADRGLRTAATAAYFADALGRGDRDLCDAPRLVELADHADDLADSTESEEIRRLAEAIDTANRMM